MSSSLERIESVLAGRKPDRPPVSFWYHFAADQVAGPRAVDAHVAHLRKYDLDFLKVMNDNGYPHAAARVERASDLASLRRLRGDEPAFAAQLELVSALRRAVGDEVPLISTIFNAWATLRSLVRPPAGHRPPNLDAQADQPSGQIRQMLEAEESAVQRALGTIGQNLAEFARRCISAGADGIFLSVRDDWLADPARPGLYERLVRPSDLAILSATAPNARLNMLHVCGRAVDFAAFAQYPVQVINWADRAAGPSIADAAGWLKPAICAGVDNLSTLPNGTPDGVRNEVRDALRQAGSRPMIVAPGCTYDPQRVPESNLRAMVDAATSYRYPA